ncbi:MAG TPA: helix-turn-helix domain-containing protein [Treponemataceae bacterium]|nr:helix-turn-helix domain-containing protein [Treponemataceae bacterium]
MYEIRARVRVCIVNVCKSYLSAVYGMKDILEYANDPDAQPFEVSILDVAEFCRAKIRYDLVIVPPFKASGGIGPASLAQGLVAALGRAIARGSVPVSVCAGAFYLCETGVADGKEVTTHWSLASALARSYPRVTVRMERVLIDGGSYISGGGLTSFQDLSLHLIRKYASVETALDVARGFLIDPGSRTQLQYVKRSLEESESGGDTVSRAKAFMHNRLADPLSLGEISAHCGVTSRTLLRHFARAGAGTPAEYLKDVRIENARALLESSRNPIKTIAADSGYRDLPAFIRAFRGITGVSPGEYRKRFNCSADGNRAGFA